MSRHFQRYSAIFSANRSPICIRRTRRIGITVRIDNITDFGISPPTCTTDQSSFSKACRIQWVHFRIYHISHTLRIELSPTFIKNDPLNNAGMIFQSIYNRFWFRFKICFCKIFMTFGQIRTRQVLPNQNSLFIAMIIPTSWLGLDMFTHHIETQVFHRADIE